MKHFSAFLPFVILILLSFFTIRPFFNEGFFPMHDDTQVGRVVAMGKALKEGQFPVRWVADLGYGYGYPIFNFYGPLPYYVGGLFFVLGFSGLMATKMMFIVGIVLAALVMYKVSHSLFGIAGAMTAAIFYIYAPYHAVQIYVRGAVGEFWVLVFWPLILWSIWRGDKGLQIYKTIIVGSIGLAGAILSHTLLGFATVLFLCVALGMFWFFRRKIVVSHVLMLLGGLGLSSFFWLPAVVEKTYTSVQSQIGTSANFQDHFLCIGQLWASEWGYAGSAPGCIDGMSFSLGKLYILISFIAIIFIILTKKTNTYFWTAIILILLGLFLVLPISSTFWELIPSFAYMQYPWRFLTFFIIGMSILAGAFIAVLNIKWQRTLVAIMTIFLIIFFNTKWFSPQYIYQKNASEFETIQDLRWRVSKISDEYLPASLRRPQELSGIVFDTIVKGPGVEVITVFDTAIYRKYIVQVDSTMKIRVNIANFPGWKYFINQKEVQAQSVDGIVLLEVPKGASTVELKFSNTWVRMLGNSISLLSSIVLFYIYAKKQKIKS